MAENRRAQSKCSLPALAVRALERKSSLRFPLPITRLCTLVDLLSSPMAMAKRKASKESREKEEKAGRELESNEGETTRRSPRQLHCDP